MAVCWLFPGKTVRIDTVCLDCNEPIVLEVRDGKILSSSPDEGIVGISVFGFGFMGGGDIAGRN
ncbi:MAG: hypothetical protein FI713_04990 [SAR202 cluster bacterium]|nr:hypothetical protein [SAR202 cluster bacterium]HAE32372.1 hypothetical protein [Dehalococcoidia bacterium]